MFIFKNLDKQGCKRSM